LNCADPENLAPILKFADRMLPSQRAALYERATAASVSGFVAAVTQLGVADVTLSKMPAEVFRANLNEIRPVVENLTEIENVLKLPLHLVNPNFT
jgi:hypothetical protein